MEIFKVGDKVKLLHSTEEGIIIQVYPNNRALVLIDDIMEQELDIREIVHKDPPKQPTRVLSASEHLLINYREIEPGLYLSLDIDRADEYVYSITNHTTFRVMYLLFIQKTEKKFSGQLMGQIEPGTAQLLFRFRAEKWEDYAQLFFQFLLFKTELEAPFDAIKRKVRIKTQTFQKERRLNPYLKKNVVLVPVSVVSQFEPLQLDTKTQTENAAPHLPLPANPPPNPTAHITVEKPWHEIDLHINCLVEDPKGMTPAAMLLKQIEVFEHCLHNAIAWSMESIGFIHGIGEGKLKGEIHNRLKRMKKERKIRDFALENTGHVNAGLTKVYIK